MHNHENNVPSRLSLQWLCGNSCIWAQSVHHVSKCMSYHEAIAVITGRAHCFHNCICISKKKNFKTLYNL